MLAERSPCAVKGCVPASGSTCWANEAQPNVKSRLARIQRCISRKRFRAQLGTTNARVKATTGFDAAIKIVVRPWRCRLKAAFLARPERRLQRQPHARPTV